MTIAAITSITFLNTTVISNFLIKEEHLFPPSLIYCYDLNPGPKLDSLIPHHRRPLPSPQNILHSHTNSHPPPHVLLLRAAKSLRPPKSHPRFSGLRHPPIHPSLLLFPSREPSPPNGRNQSQYLFYRYAVNHNIKLIFGELDPVEQNRKNRKKYYHWEVSEEDRLFTDQNDKIYQIIMTYLRGKEEPNFT